MYHFCYSMNDFYKYQHSHGLTLRRKVAKVKKKNKYNK